MLRVGTRSLLFGVHQFLLHPIFVAVAWERLYGQWPRDWRVWLAIIVHDWGYWGKPNMDGSSGKTHPWMAARWFTRWFDDEVESLTGLGEWGVFCLLHSRSMSHFWTMPVSMLCAPDKVGSFLMPRWLYLKLARCSGELDEYINDAGSESARAHGLRCDSPEAWYDSVKLYLKRWAVADVAGRFQAVASLALNRSPQEGDRVDLVGSLQMTVIWNGKEWVKADV